MNQCYVALPRSDCRFAPVRDRLWSNNLMQLIFDDLLAKNPLLRQYESCNKTGSASRQSTCNDDYCSSSDTTDFTLHLDDGDIKVHKLLLISSSKYFRCMLDTDCEEKSVGAVSLPNIKLDNIFVLLKYIYTGIAHLENDNFLDVWQLADYFQILPLVKLCCHFAKVYLHTENCLLVYYQAVIHQFHDLAWQAMSFACYHLTDILENVPHHLKDASPSTMKAIIRHPSFINGIPPLLKFFEVLKVWCQYNTARYQYISWMLTIAELCVLANQFPEMAAQLTLHPQATLQEEHTHQNTFNALFVQTSLMHQQIVITFGGQHSGTIMKCGESYTPESQHYHSENNSQLGHPHKWTLGYLTPDIQDAIQFRKHINDTDCQILLPNQSLMESARSEQNDQENRTSTDHRNGWGCGEATGNVSNKVPLPAAPAVATTVTEGRSPPSSEMEANVIVRAGGQTRPACGRNPEDDKLDDKRTYKPNTMDIENITYGIGDAKLDKILSVAFHDRFVYRENFLSAQLSTQWCLNSSLLNTNRIIKECGAVMSGAVASFVNTNKIVILGGRDASGPVNTVQQYCIDSNSWSLLPPLPTPVYGGGAAVINRNLYYVAGATTTTAATDIDEGSGSRHNNDDRRGTENNVNPDSNPWSGRDTSPPYTTRYLNNLWCLKPGTGHWVEMSSLPGDGRCHVAVAVLNDSLVVMGGLTRDEGGYPGVAGSEDSAHCWLYEPLTDEWTRIGNLRQGRAYHGAAVSYHKLYVMGGKSGRTWLSSVERYHPCTDSWVHVPDMLTPRSEFGVTVHNDNIFVMGGFTGYKATNQVECYSALSKSWQPRPNMRMDRVGPVAATVRVPLWKDSFIRPTFWP